MRRPHRVRPAGPVVAAALLLAVSSCAHRAAPRPGETVTLRVAYVVNPDLPGANPGTLRAVLAAARRGVMESFGVDVEFTEPEEQALKALFDRATPGERRRWSGLSYDFKNGGGDLTRLVRGYAAALRSDESGLDDLIAYAQPYLLAPVRERSYEGLAEAVTATLLARLDRLKAQKLPGGNSLIDASPNNEVLYWAFIGKLSFPYDVVITNQLIASAEYVGSSIHTAIRGGITNGITASNPYSPRGTTAIVSLYPVFGEDAVTRSLRGDESYSEADGARFAGFLLVHEIGHQLFDLGHPYGRTACVMDPPELLRLREWVARLSPAGCPVGKP
ncbi:MAG TPA: hypothetical protein VJO54_00140 [Burkholderiales bacterium]|nr:hypothetical protein [Burkholderiales bacterium]